MTLRNQFLMAGAPAGRREHQRGVSRRRGSAPVSSSAAAATKTYVEPGKKDEYYLFYSGGHSGQVYVAGLPSMRHISTIPGLRAVSGDRLRL